VANEARPSEVTRILQEMSAPEALPSGRSAATERLLVLVYDELRRVASRIMSGERPGHTLQPTALVHEAYLKLVDQESLRWNDRAHFMGIAARAMRQILVDHARRRSAEKRGGEYQRVTFLEDLAIGPSAEVELLELHEALEKLALEDERSARVAELRLFGGLSIIEVAEVLGVSQRTVFGDWSVARLWLSRQLRGTQGDGA